MNARQYRVDIKDSPLDFNVNAGLVDSSVSYQSEPKLIKNMVLLTITKKYIVSEMGTDSHHEVLSVESIYEIPCNEIKNRNDVYEFYKDATRSLNETYQKHKMQLPALLNIVFPTLPIEAYQKEIDRVFNLLNSRN